MSKFKLKEATFDGKTSVVLLKTPLGICKGVAKVHPKDEDSCSQFVGCRYAEQRAKVNYYKKRIKEWEKTRKDFLAFYGQLTQMKNFNPRSFEAKKMRRKIHELAALIQRDKEFINFLEANIVEADKVRENFLEKYVKKDNNK